MKLAIEFSRGHLTVEETEKIATDLEALKAQGRRDGLEECLLICDGVREEREAGANDLRLDTSERYFCVGIVSAGKTIASRVRTLIDREPQL